MADYTSQFTGSQIDARLAKVPQLETALAGKQATLVGSGTGQNIKTINNQNILGSGNIDAGSLVTIDSALSTTSTNPVQNKVINTALNGKQATLVSGVNIATINNQSLLEGGNITVGGGGGSGSVTSVAMTVPTGLSVSGSPITTSGTLAVSLASGYKIPTTSELSDLAPKASPAFTGTPTAPTATAGTNTTQIATTAFVQAAVSSSGGGTVTSVGLTVPTGLSVSGSPITSSGTLAISLASGYKIPTTTELSALAPKASPDLTGTPTAPTAAAGTNTTQIATTAFVSSAMGGKQDTLIGSGAGQNIKTINNTNILGSGNLNVGDEYAVKFTSQSLTTSQQEQARSNIGAASLSDINTTDYVTVTTLPTASASTLGPIYLVGPDSSNNYERYVTKQNGSSYEWVSLGSTAIDLSDYATTDDLFAVESQLYRQVDISGLTQWKRIITSAGKWQSYSTGYLSVDIPIKPGQRVIVKANTTNAHIALLKSETYTSGTTPDFCSGYSGRIVVSAGSYYKFTAPSDAAFLYTTIQSNGTNLDSQIFFYFLEEIDRNVISKVDHLCVSRYKRPDMNPNGLYYNSYIAVSRRFNSSYDSVLVFGNKDAAAVTNKFWDLFGFYVITRGEEYINFPADVTSFGTGIANSTTTDSILPVIVGAVNNIDGDNSSKWFTGQNHAYGNEAAGETPTMREVSCDVSVDGVSVGLNNLGIRGDVCTIDVVNMVQGYNTCKQDGTGREIIKQKIAVRIDNDKCVIRVEYIALEDVVFYNIPGFGMYGAPNTGRKFRFIGSLTKPLAYDYNATTVSPSSSDNRINALQFSRNGMALEVYVKDVGLGNMKLNTTENNAYATNANKVYTRLTASDTAFSLPSGGMLAFELEMFVKDLII